MNRAILPTALASILAGGIVASSVLMTSSKPVEAYTVDFSEGTYSKWNGSKYTFDWYRNPTVENGVTTYTISSASDLAGLAVVTNNLSGNDFKYIANKVATADKEFVALVDDFEGDVVKLDTDIDLRNYKWLGIGYPWSTPALTASTEFVNTEGQTVTYNAVDHIPDETVDPWVGDKNGNPISTRYKELPESELRFRDYLQPLTRDSFFDIENVSVDLNLMSSLNVSIESTSTSDSPIYCDDYESHSIKVTLPAIQRTNQFDFDTDIAVPYTFKNIKGYIETKGFAGTFEGNNHKIKNLSPDRTWVSDYTKRLHTYEPLARGLFSVVDEKGAIKNLNVQGKYTSGDPVSYSAFLCAYNYGLIDNCYVDGTMTQSVITQKCPVARDYDPDGTTYELSSSTMTVMPSGNSGFMTSQNYGTISNSYTVGNATQVFRQFGFFAATNYGTIDNCLNTADLISSKKTITFHTDEWGCYSSQKITYIDPKVIWGEDYDHWATTANDMYRPFTTNEFIYGVSSCDLNSHQLSSQIKFYTNVSAPNSDSTKGGRSVGLRYMPTTLAYYAGVLNLQGNYRFDFDESVWVPFIFNAMNGESIAANHIYGMYLEELMGGIAGLNQGVINNCENQGKVKYGSNITSDLRFSAYDGSYNSISKAKDVYDYIRLDNAYGIFSTAGPRASLAGGIAGLNIGSIQSVKNSGDVEIITAGTLQATSPEHLLAIAATQNGFYQNDVRYITASGEVYYSPYGFRWWANDETRDAGDRVASDQGKTFHYDRNMPYPYYVPTNALPAKNFQAGITGINMGEISGAVNNNNCIYSIAVYSRDNPKTHTESYISEIHDCSSTADSYAATHHIYDTVLKDIDITMQLAYSTIAQTKDYNLVGGNIKSSTKLADIISCADTGTFNMTTVAAPMLCDSSYNTNYKDVYTYNRLFDSDCIKGSISSSLISNSTNYNDGYEHTQDECIGAVIAPIVKQVTVSDLAVVNSDCDSLGTFTDCELSDIYVNNLYKVNEESQMKSGIGTFYNSSLKDIQVFGNDAFISCDGCTVDGLMTVGTVTSDYINSHGGEYVYMFHNSVCKDMLLESEVDFEYTDPLQSGKFQEIPGILKAYTDTNTFTNCVIMTPDGMVTYPSSNITYDPDDSIKSDAQMVYSKHAQENGALAYYLDHGYEANRTFDYAVATADKVNFKDYIPSSVKEYISSEHLVEIEQEHTLPAYTRKKIDSSEKSYYRVKSDSVSAATGYLTLSVERDGKTWSTENTNKLFPKTEVFLIPGENLNIKSTAEDGYELLGLTLKTKDKETKLESTSGKDCSYTFDSITMPNEDIELLSEWSGIYDIEIDDSLVEWVQLNVSATKSSKDKEVYVSYDVKDPAYALSEIYYYKYRNTGDNNWIIDTTEKYNIDLEKGSFIMPGTKIRLYATQLDNLTELNDIVIAGVHGTFETPHKITVKLDSSVDITNLTVDSVEMSPDATISPAIDEPQDFTKAVEYTVTAESGQSSSYIVQVQTVKDGFITQFDLKGRHGVIDDDKGTITVSLPDSENITNVKPYIVWSGTKIEPDISEAQDFTQDITYTVTSSKGDIKEYKIVINRQLFDSNIEDLQLQLGDYELGYTVNKDTKTILVEYPYGEDVSDVYLKSFAFNGADSNIEEGQHLNLTVTNKIIIVDSTGGTETYTLTSVEQVNPAKEITQFVLYGYNGVINQDTGEIVVTLPAKYDISNIAPDAVEFNGKSLAEFVTKQDFTKPVTYTVKGFNDTTKQYTVKVIQN